MVKNLIPVQDLHEKGPQRQQGLGTMVNSQQRRALEVPMINRGKTTDQLVVNRTLSSLSCLDRISYFRAGERTFRTVFYSALEGQRWLLASKATELSAPCSAQRRPATPSALRRADPICPLCVRILNSTSLARHVFELSTCISHAALLRISLVALLLCQALLRTVFFTF